jgi:hypothetical protein
VPTCQPIDNIVYFSSNNDNGNYGEFAPHRCVKRQVSQQAMASFRIVQLGFHRHACFLGKPQQVVDRQQTWNLAIALTIAFLFSSTDGNSTQDVGSDEILRWLDLFGDLVRKHSAGKKIRSEHTWWQQFARFPSSVLLCDQLGVTESELAKALGGSSVTEKTITQHAGGGLLFVRNFHDVDFVTVLQLGRDVMMLEQDVVPSLERIAHRDCSEVDTLLQSIMRCRTRSDSSRTQEMLGKHRCQEDRRAAGASKKSKEQDQSLTIRKHLRSSLEPIAASVGRDVVTVLDLTAPDEPAADNLVHPPESAKLSRFHLRDLELPSGATAKGETPVKIP